MTATSNLPHLKSSSWIKNYSLSAGNDGEDSSSFLGKKKVQDAEKEGLYENSCSRALTPARDSKTGQQGSWNMFPHPYGCWSKLECMIWTTHDDHDALLVVLLSYNVLRWLNYAKNNMPMYALILMKCAILIIFLKISTYLVNMTHCSFFWLEICICSPRAERGGISGKWMLTLWKPTSAKILGTAYASPFSLLIPAPSIPVTQETFLPL